MFADVLRNGAIFERRTAAIGGVGDVVPEDGSGGAFRRWPHQLPVAGGSAQHDAGNAAGHSVDDVDFYLFTNVALVFHSRTVGYRHGSLRILPRRRQATHRPQVNI